MSYRSVDHRPIKPEYVKIVRAASATEFEILLNEALRMGWRPLGNMVVSEGVYTQMMAKYDESNDNWAGPM